ncbi:MAG: tetratricopeptide repeat protein [Candidatus Nanopelagicales bacterium]
MSNISAYGAVDLAALAAARKAQDQADHRAEERAAARAANPDATPLVIDVTDSTFQTDVLDLSMRVPVVIDLWATWCGPCRTLSPILERLAAEYAGRWVLAKVDVDANPAISQAFQVQSIPSVFAVVGGRPLPLFQGALPAVQVKAYLDELLKVAVANGVSGTVSGGPEGAASAEEPVDPRMEAAYDAIEAGDWAAARAAYQSILAESPRDPVARAGVALVGVFERVSGLDHAAVLAAADAAPDDLAAQQRAADVLVLDGRPVEAFARMIGAIRFTTGPERERLRAHLIDLFEVVGPEDPSVSRARTDLANALF